MRRTALLLFALVVACSDNPAQSAAPVATTGEPTTVTTPQEVMSTPPTTISTTAAVPTSTAPPTTRQQAVPVTDPGTYTDASFVIHLSFRSEIGDVTSDEFAAVALAILNDAGGWGRSGFEFIADDASGLRVVLAEADRVDELCLPLDTGGTASCQNGPVVALNADRWRSAGLDWDSTVAAYRTYLVNHEVGHLIGLRHPAERCPSALKVSAVMEPQTNNLQGCTGNGVPLEWEIAWAARRPVVVGPTPDWDGPRPSWPVGSGE